MKVMWGKASNEDNEDLEQKQGTQTSLKIGYRAKKRSTEQRDY